MRKHLPLAALIAFGAVFIGIIVLANQGRGFWGFLQQIPGGDKLGHVGLVGTLALLCNLTLRLRTLPAPFHRIQLGSALVAIAMSLEELSQWFLPTRSPDLLDGIANLAGAALAQVAAIRMVSRLRPERRTSARAAE
ncbi:trypsin [Haloferula sp. A504]|uniref:trypsin n=1 Tax=Haloferula sp. A504 TaxID=3373601 RepID=UPI0031CA6B03|nr:hypothetical protein [Verrucomicrobiaceae bacterium E54]